MADILTLVFRTFSPQTGPTTPDITSTVSSCSTLVVGERSINRSLLLLAAVTAASDLEKKVLFFTQTQIQSLPVSLQNYGSNLTPDVLKKIKFAYPKTMEQLLQQVACLHESTTTSVAPPSLIIVDGLEGYLHNANPAGTGGAGYAVYQQGEQSCAAHVSALLYDTAAFLTRVLEQRNLAPCRVIASFQAPGEGTVGGEPSAPDPILPVLDRYFPVRCTLNRRERRYNAPSTEALEEGWHVYLSGTGITEAKGEEEDFSLEWLLTTRPNKSMEFKVVRQPGP